MKTCLYFTFFGKEATCPLVFLHGFMGRAASFLPLVSYLPENVGSVGIDLPGHGNSLFTGSSCIDALQSFADVSSMILEDLDILGIRRFFIYGYSMGGRIAQQVALAAPDRVRALIIESAAFGIADLQARKTRYASDRRLFDQIRCEKDFEAFINRWHDMSLFATLSPESKARLATEKRANDISQLKKAMALLSVGRQPYLLPELSAARFPMFLFYGAKDAKYMAIAADAAELIPKACFHVFPGASHDIHTQYPREVAHVIAGLIRS